MSDNEEEEQEIQEPIDFVNVLHSDKSTNQDLKSIIDCHIQAALTKIVPVLDDLEDDFEEDLKLTEFLKASFKNLESYISKKKIEELNTYYKRALKSQMLFYGYNDSYVKAEKHFVPMICCLNNFPALLEAIQSVYLCLLSNYTNSIGSSAFNGPTPDEDCFDNTIKKLKISNPSEKICKLFQRMVSRNGFIKPFFENELGQQVQKKFGFENRFNFDKFSSVFSVLTGNDQDSFKDICKLMLEQTKNTPLMFLSRFLDSESRIFKDTQSSQSSFLSSPPHSYQQLVIDQLAICFKVPDEEYYEEDADGENQNNDENQNEEEEVEDLPKYYLQMLSANLRLNKPPEKIPETDIYKILEIKPSTEEVPADINIRGTSSTPFYYSLENEEEWQEKLELSNYTRIVDGLHPIEVQLLRILELSSLKNFSDDYNNEYEEIFNGIFKDSPDSEDQIKISRTIISMLLYPQTKFNLTEESTDLFILSCFSELFKLLKSAKTDYNSEGSKDYLYPGKVRRVFQLAMDGIIPAVHRNIVTLAHWAQGSVKKNDSDFDEPDDETYHSIFPHSIPIFLEQFLFNPSLRKKCPVMYAFLRLQPRFCLVKSVDTISRLLSRLWDAWSNKNKDAELPAGDNVTNDDGENEPEENETFEDLGIFDDELKPFLECWQKACKFVNSGPLSEKARNRLDRTLEYANKVDDNEAEEVTNDDGLVVTLARETKVRLFLPYEPSAWPGLIVLESLSQAHNEFISILQQHSKINALNVNDKDFDPLSQSLETSIFGQCIIRAIRGHLGPDCQPIFDENIERKFIQQVSIIPYYYVLHPMVNFAAKNDISISSKSIATLFEEHFDVIDLSDEQKRVLFKFIKEQQRTAGALLLLSKFMFSALDNYNSQKEDTFQSTTSLVEFIERTKIDQKITNVIEKESYSALLAAKGKLKEDFKLGQFSKIYTFLSEPVDECRKAYSLQEAIIDNVIEKCGIKPVEIDNISLSQVTDYRPFFTVIPKVFGDLLSNNKCVNDKSFKDLPPTELIKIWEGFDEKTRMLIDDDERKALDIIKELDKSRNGSKLTSLISYFNDAKDNYKW